MKDVKITIKSWYQKFKRDITWIAAVYFIILIIGYFTTLIQKINVMAMPEDVTCESVPIKSAVASILNHKKCSLVERMGTNGKQVCIVVVKS
jgi:hypothetical protein